jgi:hypothetical protein
MDLQDVMSQGGCLLQAVSGQLGITRYKSLGFTAQETLQAQQLVHLFITLAGTLKEALYPQISLFPSPRSPVTRASSINSSSGRRCAWPLSFLLSALQLMCISRAASLRDMPRKASPAANRVRPIVCPIQHPTKEHMFLYLPSIGERAGTVNAVWHLDSKPRFCPVCVLKNA